VKYGDLSRRRQLARTRDVARHVVARYIHGGYRLRLLAHTDNTSYHVTLSHAGDSYVLRLAGKPSPQVESEIAWLRALADAGYPVPNPLVTLDGSRVVPVTIPGTDATRTASVWRWVAGRAVGVNASPSVAWRLGVLVARLHSHAERFDVPAGFRRPVMDTDGLFEALPDFCREPT
jgi:Ser/Thr protein kinase RdoA (MazF antagonist)